MSKLKAAGFTISIDGYGAGPDQGLEHPLGRGGEDLHQWLVATATFQERHGGGGEPGKAGTAEAGSPDDDFARRAFQHVGAWIMGRNMFGPVRGPWPDESWRGWWGETPPFHAPVFVLTHHKRPPLEMEGGTIFHFVTGGEQEALERAREAAAGEDVLVGGGVATIRRYLEARLLDEIHVAIAPILLGGGEALFAGLDLVNLGYEITECVPSQNATHVVLSKAGAGEKA